jgi:hypothetical protein
VIVRLMGEGQYRVEGDAVETLHRLDSEAGAALERGDEQELHRLLKEMGTLVREQGERLDDADLSASDGIVPPDDLTLDEAKELFEGEGLIPDLPTPD